MSIWKFPNASASPEETNHTEVIVLTYDSPQPKEQQEKISTYRNDQAKDVNTHAAETQSATTPSIEDIHIPVDKLSLFASHLGLTTLLAVAFATIVYVKKRGRDRLLNMESKFLPISHKN